jgi:hypothetical protein
MDVGKSDAVCKTRWPVQFACYVADKSLIVHRVNEERPARTIGIGDVHRLVDVGANNLGVVRNVKKPIKTQGNRWWRRGGAEHHARPQQPQVIAKYGVLCVL